MFFSSAPIRRAACPGISPSGFPLSSPRRGLEVQGRLNRSRWLSTPPGVAGSVSRGCPSRTPPGYVSLLLLEYFSLRRDTPDPLVRSTCVGEVSFQPPNPVTHSFVALRYVFSRSSLEDLPQAGIFLRTWTSSMFEMPLDGATHESSLPSPCGVERLTTRHTMAATPFRGSLHHQVLPPPISCLTANRMRRNISTESSLVKEHTIVTLSKL